MKTVVIAGGAGFIRSHLVDRVLKNGDKVIVIDDLSTGSRDNISDAKRLHPDRISFHELDICSTECSELIKSEAGHPSYFSGTMECKGFDEKSS